MTNTDSDNSREWAAQAYALLKKRQEEQKQELEKQEEQKQELIDIASKKNILGQSKTIADTELGEFDDNFTWSAMVLAAQGKKINQISLDEIDWLTKLRRGLEETRKGFVTELLDKLGDDPLTPESLDDLETLLIRADVGINSTDKELRERYVKFLFEKLQRKEGLLERDCDKLIRNDRVIWGACMVSCGDADAMVTGNTRRYSSSLEKITKVVDPRPGEIMFGLNMIINRGKTIFVCDTSVIEYPDANQLAEMAISTARVVRLFGFDPKVAFLSHSTFGQPATDRTKRISDAVQILKERKVDFKFDGEMQPDVALEETYKELYPFSEIVGNANVLIMPSQHSAAISFKTMKSMSRAKVIGPLLIGLGQAIEIAPLRSSTSEILNLASVAAYSAGVIDYNKKN